jgi:hypothetical protein
VCTLEKQVCGNNYNSVVVYQYTLLGDYVGSFSSTTDAQDKTGIYMDWIYKVLKWNCVNAGGFVCSYENEDKINFDGLRLAVKEYV